VEIEAGDVRLFVDVDGAKVRRSGADAHEVPTIVVVHDGPGADHTTFKHPAFAPKLTPHAQLVFYDHRGHGRSDESTPDRWRLDVWATDLRALVDTLGIQDPIVFGSGFGALVATRFASLNPGRLARLVLSRPVTRFDARRSVDIFARTVGPDAAESVLDFYASPNETSYAAWVVAIMRAYTSFTAAEVADLLLSANWRSAPAIEWYAHEAKKFDLRSDAGALSVPTLVLGGEDDALCPIESVEEFASAVDGSLVRFERFPTRHAIYADDPRAMEITLEFIAGG